MRAVDSAEAIAEVVEHDGMMWKPKRGATTTADELIAARMLFQEINDDAHWNAWVAEDRAEEFDQAVQVMGQWTRAEPGHRVMTIKQWEAGVARREREREKAKAADDRRHEKASKLYDPDRAGARLSMIEQQSRLVYESNELARFLDGSRFPAMQSDRRTEEIAKLHDTIARLRGQVEGLSATVGNPEEVVDERGWLPRERRESMLIHFKYGRERTVRALRASVPMLEAESNAALDKGERSGRRSRLASAKRDLEELLEIPPLEAADMCSECPTPSSQHGWVTPPFKGPCPAWPGWASRVREARKMLETFSRRAQERNPEPPKPQPLAVVPSGLSISQVMARLADIQERHPTAEVRRGRANRWEVWPGADDSGRSQTGESAESDA